MWAKIHILEYLEYVQKLKFRLGTKDFNDNINLLFIFISFLFVFYFLFYKFLNVRPKLKYKCKKVKFCTFPILEATNQIKSVTSQAQANDKFVLEVYFFLLFDNIFDFVSLLFFTRRAEY